VSNVFYIAPYPPIVSCSMHFTEAETEELKKWVVKKLEDISDADSDVLADYVLALVKSEESESQVRANCLENLEDFLHERELSSSPLGPPKTVNS